MILKQGILAPTSSSPHPSPTGRGSFTAFVETPCVKTMVWQALATPHMGHCILMTVCYSVVNAQCAESKGGRCWLHQPPLRDYSRFWGSLISMLTFKLNFSLRQPSQARRTQTNVDSICSSPYLQTGGGGFRPLSSVDAAHLSTLRIARFFPTRNGFVVAQAPLQAHLTESISVPEKAVPHLYHPISEPLRHRQRPVGQNRIRPRPLQCQQAFQHHCPPVQRPGGGGKL
jgi:hypothetical protein